MNSGSRMRPFLVLLGLGLVALPVDAAQFEVTTTADGADAAPGDGDCVTAGGDCSLRAAIEEANALRGFDTVALAAGVHVVAAPAAPDEDDAGQIAIGEDMEIIGAGADRTFIDGGGAAAIFHVIGARVRISALTVRRGDGSLRPVLESSDGELTLERFGFADNTGARFGGSIVNLGNLSIFNSVFEDNRGELIEHRGGHLLLDGVVMRRNDSTVYDEGYVFPVRVLRSEIAENGVGLYGCVTVVDSVLRDNTNWGIACESGGVVVSGSTISGNGGAGINSDGGVRVVDSTIRGNGWVLSPPVALPSGLGAVGNGGIIAIGKVVVQRSTIEGNLGYGINVEIAADVENTTIVGNDVGLYVGEELSRVESSTIAGNTEIGLWVFDEATLVVRNSIVSGNGDDCSGVVDLGGFNIVGDIEGCDASPPASDRIGIDPLLGPLQGNGGPTQTMAPLDGSPALDGEAAGEPGACPTVDQRGVLRPQGSGCDAGAVERLVACGDGVLDAGEVCDDGNTDAGDCCSPICRFEEVVAGDCDGDGRVAVSDLVLAVGFATQRRFPIDCRAADRDGDLSIEIAEIVTAVGNALDGIQLECPAP